MTTIHLLCAAESDGDRGRIAEGHLDFPLSICGQQQAQALHTWAESHPVSAVYTSDLRRAYDTAAAAFSDAGIPIHTDDTLRELSLGSWEGALWGNLAYEEPRRLEAFRQLDPGWRASGAESLHEGASRLQNRLLTLAEEYPSKTIAAVSHRYLAGALLSVLAPEQAAAYPEPCTLICLEADESCLRVSSILDGQSLIRSLDPGAAPARTVPDFDTDACCYLLREIEYGDTFAEAVESVWAESGEPRPFSRDILMEDASRRTTWLGFVEQTPACFLQMGPIPGWITLLVVHPGCRNLGVGSQMLALAALSARNSGMDTLSILLPPDNPHRTFFVNHGFTSEGLTEDGRELMARML